jgi:O-antigen/teichoic acid export membrane protein
MDFTIVTVLKNFRGPTFNLKISKTIRNIQWSFISLAITSFVHLLLRIIFGKKLGPSGLGLYTLTFTIYLFGMQFAAFGIGSALTKYVAENYDYIPKVKEFVSAGVAGSILSGSLMGFLLYLFSESISIQVFKSPEMVDLLKITSFCFPFIAMQKAVLGALNGLQKMKLYAIFGIVHTISIMILSIFLVMLLDMNVKGAIIGFVVPTIVVGLLSLTFVKEYFIPESTILVTALKEVTWFGFYVVLANSIALVNTQIDSLMIGYFMDKTEVGYYAVAVTLVEGLNLIPEAVQRVSYATISNYYGRKSYKNMIRFMKSSVLNVFVMTAFSSFELVLFGQSIIEILFSKEFLLAYPPLLILLVGYSINAPISSINGTLQSIGKITLLFRISLMCAIINLLLNFLLIPEYGINGAAIATSISLTLVALLKVYFINKYIPKYS